MFTLEGSEDELEITSQHLKTEDSEQDQKMVPPQNDTDVTSIKTEIDYSDYPNNNAFKTLINNNRNLKISLKSAEELYARDRLVKQEHNNDYYDKINIKNEQMNGYNSSNETYLRVKENVLANNILPPELELSDNGVFAKSTILKSTKYGPFQGKWAGLPQNPKYAWEVSLILIQKPLTRFFFQI